MNIVNNYDDYLPVIAETKLFSNIPSNLYSRVLRFLGATVKRYEKDEFIQRLGEPFLYSGIVLDGTVEGSFLSENYSKININHFPVGMSFGEALSCVQTDYSPIQLKALTDCTIMFLNLKQIMANSECDCSYHRPLSINLINILANQNVFSNLKLRIANQKALRDRVLMYLHSLAPDSDGYVNVPFTRTALAEFLGVNRSALARELGKMQDDGLIQVDGKKIKLLF